MENLSVRFDKSSSTSVYYQVDKIIIHEQYSPKNLAHDIALVKLRQQVSFKDGIRPICLPSSALHWSLRLNGVKGYVTGEFS